MQKDKQEYDFDIELLQNKWDNITEETMKTHEYHIYPKNFSSRFLKLPLKEVDTHHLTLSFRQSEYYSEQNCLFIQFNTLYLPIDDVLYW